jgi:NADPH:quinone reductase-like Zn-dependent oxidoreductase
MQRVVYTQRGGLEAIEIVDEENPIPATGEVVVEVHRAGINFADLMMRQGLYQPTPPFPFTPGYEVSGTISALGEGVENLTIGERVLALCGMGGYSQQVAVASDRVFKLPDDVDFDTAAALPVTYLTTYHMLKYLGNFQPNDTILIHHAAGGVGTATAQIGKALGAGIIIGTASTAKSDFVNELGMRYIDREAEDFVAVCKKETGGKGVHHALDPVGGKHLLRSYKALRNGGNLYAFGGSSAVRGSKRSLRAALGFLWGMPKFDPMRMMSSNKAVFGVHMGTWPDHEVLKGHMEELSKMLTRGEISPIVDKVFHYTDVASAQQYIHDRKNRGKVLINFRPK